MLHVQSTVISVGILKFDTKTLADFYAIYWRFVDDQSSPYIRNYHFWEINAPRNSLWTIPCYCVMFFSHQVFLQ